MAAVIVVGARIVIGRVAGKQMVDGQEDGVGDRDDRFLVPAVPHDPAVAGGEGPLPSACRPRGRPRGFRGDYQ